MLYCTTVQSYILSPSPLLVLPFYPDSYGRRGGGVIMEPSTSQQLEKGIEKGSGKKCFSRSRKKILLVFTVLNKEYETYGNLLCIGESGTFVQEWRKAASVSLSSSLDPLSISLPPPEGKGGRMEKRGKGSLSDLEEIPFITSFFFLFPFFPLKEKKGLRPSRLYRKEDERRDNSLSFFFPPPSD